MRRPMGSRQLLSAIMGGVLGLMACQLATPTPIPTAAVWPPTPTLAILATPIATPEPPRNPTSAPAPTATPSADTGWELLREGLERRQITLPEANETLTILRLAPEQFRWEVGYSPGRPQILADWQRQTGALLVVNGGYFTPEFTATGLIIADGQASGASYVGFGGMVVVDGAGTAALRSLADQPYNSQEEWSAAVQSFPLLVKPGGQLGFPADQEAGQRARRTVIGQDVHGRILLIIAPRGGFTLHQLSAWLTASDLELDLALNLDGGPSTGLFLADPSLTIPAFSALPIVLLVYKR